MNLLKLLTIFLVCLLASQPLYALESEDSIEVLFGENEFGEMTVTIQTDTPDSESVASMAEYFESIAGAEVIIIEESDQTPISTESTFFGLESSIVTERIQPTDDPNGIKAN
ncbi:MAG: hypothetical protein AAGB12_01670 [Pseudomonadota bacterium]